jgi:hypothetical protein
MKNLGCVAYIGEINAKKKITELKLKKSWLLWTVPLVKLIFRNLK